MNARDLCTNLLLVGLLSAGATYAAPSDSGSAPQAYSASALYDLGNSYARQGNPGMAVLSYERARILSPNDPDIRANLHRVRTRAGLPPDSGTWLENHARVADPRLMYWLGLLSLGVAGASLLAIRFDPPRRRIGWGSLGVSGTLLAVVLCDAAATWSLFHEAVVLHATGVQVSPITKGDAMFSLPEAQVVTMTNDYNGYVLIKTNAGQSGWVRRADLAPVISSQDRHAIRRAAPP
ncbi:MAG: hypothetical protein ABJD53_18095 [Gammaproteobacteria bacterium]